MSNRLDLKNRAYAFITVKSMDDATRTIEGLATTPTPDRAGDIVNPMGAKFTLPLPFLWQHNHDEPIGHVIEATPTPKGIYFKAKLVHPDSVESASLKDLLQRAWDAIRMKLVAAVSIGFLPEKYMWLESGGIEFDEWEWYELSAVTIPMQADATITSVKSMDAILRRAAGIADPQFPLKPKAAATGKALPVVKLDTPVRARTEPFVIRKIRTAKHP